MRRVTLPLLLIFLVLASCKNKSEGGSPADSIVTETDGDTLADSLPDTLGEVAAAPVLTQDSLACLRLKMSPRKIPGEIPGFYDKVARDISDYGYVYTLSLGGDEMAMVYADENDHQVWRIMVTNPRIKAQVKDGVIVEIGQSLTALTEQLGKINIGFNEEIGAYTDAGKIEISISPEFKASGEKKLEAYDGETELKLTPADFTSSAKVDYLSLI